MCDHSTCYLTKATTQSTNTLPIINNLRAASIDYLCFHSIVGQLLTVEDRVGGGWCPVCFGLLGGIWGGVERVVEGASVCVCSVCARAALYVCGMRNPWQNSGWPCVPEQPARLEPKSTSRQEMSRLPTSTHTDTHTFRANRQTEHRAGGNRTLLPQFKTNLKV